MAPGAVPGWVLEEERYSVGVTGSLASFRYESIRMVNSPRFRLCDLIGARRSVARQGVRRLYIVVGGLVGSESVGNDS